MTFSGCCFFTNIHRIQRCFSEWSGRSLYKWTLPGIPTPCSYRLQQCPSACVSFTDSMRFDKILMNSLNTVVSRMKLMQTQRLGRVLIGVSLQWVRTHSTKNLSAPEHNLPCSEWWKSTCQPAATMHFSGNLSNIVCQNLVCLLSFPVVAYGVEPRDNTTLAYCSLTECPILESSLKASFTSFSNKARVIQEAPITANQGIGVVLISIETSMTRMLIAKTPGANMHTKYHYRLCSVHPFVSAVTSKYPTVLMI